MLSRVSRDTILTVVPSVMNARDQSCRSSVTSLCPFVTDRASLLLMWIGVMTPFVSPLEVIRTSGLHMRTFSQSVSTRLHSAKSQSVASSGIPQGSESRNKFTPTSNHAYPSPVSCHVSHCSNTNSVPLLHTSYSEHCLTICSTHVALHVITHNDTAQSEGNPHCL